jgi:hypothetical protein
MLQTVERQNAIEESQNRVEESEDSLVSTHEQIMRKGGAALEEGEIDAYLDLHVEKPVFHVFGPEEIAGDFHGKAALKQLYSNIQKMVGGTNFSTCIHDALYTKAHGIWLILFFPDRHNAYENHYTMYVVCHFYRGLISESWFVFWPKKVTISPLPPSGHEQRTWQ